MRDDLLEFYERELTFLRRLGAEFAERYPKVAGRLLLEPSKCEDPYVERMLEAFAFLTARVQLKLEDDFPEVSEALLATIYPQYIRPIPSMSVVQFHLDPEQGKLTTGLRVPMGSLLYSRPVAGVPCKFRSCYETTLWPVAVTGAQWMSPDQLRGAARGGAGEAAPVGAVRLELRCDTDVRFDKLDLRTLRFHLNGDPTVVHTLYELLLNNCSGIIVREPLRPGAPPGTRPRSLTLPASALRAVGFAADEGLLPYPRRSFLGYRLLQEYFVFPDKYLFLDLSGFDRLRAAGFGDAAEIVFLISPFERAERRMALEAGVNARVFRLGCAPVVNLFPQTAEPILLTHRQHEYRVVPDARRRLTTQSYAVESVVGVTPGSKTPLRFEPLYSHRHGDGDGVGPAGPAGRGRRAFYHATRRPAGWRADGGTELYLAFVDLSGRVVHPDLDAITVRLTCSNGDLPSRLPFGNEEGDFELEGGGPIKRIVALVKPTPEVQPPLGKPLLWRLISQLSLNLIPLVEDGPEALKELLRLHNAAGSPAADRQIEGITRLESAPAFARVAGEHGLGFARGRRVEIELDEEHFTGGSAFLFGSVLEHFLGMAVSLNSFSTLVARTRQRKSPLRRWAPRAGWRPLL